MAWVASNVESTLKVLDQSPVPSLPEASLARMTPQEREEKTRLLAQITFANLGVLATYTSATGQQVRYAPSEKEIRERQSIGESLAQTRTRAEFMRLQMWMFTLAVVAAAATGVYVRLCGGRRSEG
jgi:hypothetical protein